MARKRHSAEEIVNKLREAEVLIANGKRWATAHPTKSLRLRTVFSLFSYA